MSACEKLRNQFSVTFIMAAEIKWTVVSSRQTFMFIWHNKSQSTKSPIKDLKQKEYNNSTWHKIWHSKIISDWRSKKIGSMPVAFKNKS
jgi:hypothetical protein